MKGRKKLILTALLFGLTLGVFNPLLTWGAEMPGATNPWDIAIDSRPYPGVSLTGPLGIYYAVEVNSTCMDGASYLSTIYYTVGLTQKNQPFVFQGSTSGVCLADMVQQAGIIKAFLATSVQGIFKKVKSCKLKSIDNGSYFFTPDGTSGIFVADIEVVVQK